MNDFAKNITDFIKKPVYTVSLILTLLLGYGYQLTHYAIGTDTLPRAYYITGGLFSQGRFSSSAISWLFGFTESVPYAEEFLAVVFMFFAAAAYCAFLKKITFDKLRFEVYVVFSCLFVSYPLINEIWIYAGANLNLGIGYILSVIATLVAADFMTETKKSKKAADAVISALLIAFLMSLYEVFVLVYVMNVCILLFAGSYFSERKEKASEKTKKIIVFVLMLVIGIIIEYAVQQVYFAISGNKETLLVANRIDGSIFSLSVIRTSAGQIIKKLFLFSPAYFPLFLFAITFVFSAVAVIVLCVRRRTAFYLLTFAGLAVSLFALVFLSGGALKYRLCFNFGLYSSVVLAILLNEILVRQPEGKKTVRYIALLICAFIIMRQGIDLNGHFADNYHRWEVEERIITEMADDIEEGFSEGSLTYGKPLVFVGQYDYPDSLMSKKYLSADSKLYSMLSSVYGKCGMKFRTYDFNERYPLATGQSDYGFALNWSVGAFRDTGTESDECDPETFRILRYLGYEFNAGTWSDFDGAEKMLKDGILDVSSEEKYKGFIYETEKNIIVNIGEMR